MDDLNVDVMVSNRGITPTKTNEKPDEQYYDKRGAILSARKRTRLINLFFFLLLVK